MNEGVGAWPLALRLLHWASAALVLGALGLGVTMVQLVRDPAERFDLTQIHKGLGVVILALTAVRLVLRLALRAPKPQPAAPLMQAAARANHATLYLLLLAMPLSGWLMVSTTPVRVPTSVFGLFVLPYPLAPDLAIYRLAHTVHVAIAITLAALITLHVAAALVHVLVWRDRTLARMWGKPRAAL
jgi:cytochrome b561